MKMTYGKGFEIAQEEKIDMRAKVEALQAEISKHEQYEPLTNHTFHGGMYCRKVTQLADAIIVGKVHKKEHFLVILSGELAITEGGNVIHFIGPQVLSSFPGTKRAIYSITDSIYMTIHRTDAITVEDVEIELVEDDPKSMFGIGNILKTEKIEVK
jgi:hypothetical protein